LLGLSFMDNHRKKIRLGILSAALAGALGACNAPVTNQGSASSSGPGSLAITVSPQSIPVGETGNADVQGTFGNQTVDLTSAVTWSSSDTTIATVSNASGSWGQITGVAQGAATITAQFGSGSVSQTVNLTVGAPVLTAVQILVPLVIGQTAPQFDLGSSTDFRVFGSYSDGSLNYIGDRASLAFSNPSLVSLFGGTIYDLNSPGFEIVTATVTGTTLTGTLAFDIAPAPTPSPSPNPVTSLAVTLSTGKPIGANYYYHESFFLIATATYASGSTANVTGQATWSVSPTDDIQGVLSTPNITATGTTTVEQMVVGPSTDANEDCTITATLSGKTGSATTHLNGTGGSTQGTGIWDIAM
jgi:hypothetical protein